MPCYLVRFKGSKEAVGIYSVDDVDELLVLIDEVTDPSECECAEIPNGGVTWPDRGAATVPIDIDNYADDDDIPPIPTGLGRVSMTEGWAGACLDTELVFVPVVSLID